ncbi:hypothetical protein FNH05_32215 [Amycolatopsis rhizosphaerae]|uniref:Uncharacterized protein n=1 Tax=Amycolatopsis rhizosphaerae TaxID=2053003 RepID=A0A558ALW1_9PSEU|nr:hypothetical protein [Amycolatopsis rhizosphaerae]TVT25201.1 hypothetical protein FNH05_32215 [Amycolatopsis rhizosphaerae]
MAPPDEPGISLNREGLIDMYPDATERMFRALGQVSKAFSDALPAIRKVLEQEMTLGNGTAGKNFLNSYQTPAVETFRYAHQAPRVLDLGVEHGLTSVNQYRTVDAENAARLRSQQPGG